MPSKSRSAAQPVVDSAFRPHTWAVLSERDAAARKGHGQYFTPRPVRARLLDLLDLQPGMRVLDPGAGTGEFLLDVLERQPAVRVEGWEIDPRLVAACQSTGLLPGVIERDALEAATEGAYDIVIGNPPYYVVRGNHALAERFSDVVSGRPNIFSMFFRVGLDAVREGGRLAFVVPPSMNNGAYFEALRRWILGRAEVEHIILLDDPHLFDGAQQSVMLIVLRKGVRSDRHVFRAHYGAKGDTPIFMARPEMLEAQLAGMHTLASLGFSIRTGRCVWNQRKEDLRRKAVPGAVALVWAHNITTAREIVLVDDHAKRPQYVLESQPDVGPAIVVNRITGTVGRGMLRAALVPEGTRFVGENHVNVVTRAGGQIEPVVSHEEVLEGLRHERVALTLRLLTGNTQLSATELAHLVPICALVPPRG